MNLIKQFFSPSGLPNSQKHNYSTFIWDIGWFGVLAGSTQNFLNIYATRIGASEFQIGLLAAVSAVVSLMFTIPASRWLEGRHIKTSVFWVSIFYRIGFIFFVPLPWLFSQADQVWAIIVISFFMAVPLTALAVGFSTLFAEAVPSDLRPLFAGSRNVMMSLAFMSSSLLCGYLLTWIPFPTNYQVVFLIGFIGAMLSSYYLSKIEMEDKALPISSKHESRFDLKGYLRTDIWRTPFRVTLLLLMAFHLAQYLAIPLFPIYFVRNLNLTDNELGIGTALFYLAMLIGSAQLHQWVAKWGNKGMVGVGVVGMAIYPILLSISGNPIHYYGISLIGGYAWSFVGGASINYIIERCPSDDRPAHIAWYNVILNAAILIGSLSGPFILHTFDITSALIAFGVLRGLAGFAILKWG